MRKRIGKTVAIIAALLALAYTILVIVVRPSNQRDWSTDQAVLPFAEFDGPMVRVHNIRNFRYRSVSDFTPAYYDKSFDLRKLEKVWFVVEPFGKWRGPAHTFVTFGFGNDDYLAISVEIRKEKGESFSPLKGLLRRYEVMYVAGDERDLIALRAKYRGDQVYLYPIRTTPERMRRMLTGMLSRMNKLRAEPEFYNTLTNTCTTNLVRHVNTITPGRIPLRLGVLLPGYSDELALELGLIDTNLPLEEARRKFDITPIATRYAEDDSFSSRKRAAGR
jgi:hypothetical protein